MRYKLLGRSGLRVSELALGAMTFGEEWGTGANKTESKKVFDSYVNAGGNFIDTANLYTEGTSEKFVGEFMTGMREELVIATKYSLRMKPGDPNSAGNQRKNMVQAVEQSLRRLHTDYIDLFWVHAWDFMTPVEEVMRGLDDLVRAGKVVYVGVSDTPAWVVSQANTLADLRGWSRFVGLQIEYSLIERSADRDLLPMANAFDMAVTPWGAIGGGMLTGKYSKTRKVESATARYKPDDNQPRLNERNLAIADEVVSIAEEIGCTPAQVALNWVRSQSALIIPIVGARTEEQMIQNVSCLDITLAEEHLKRLDGISRIPLGFPHEFRERDFFKDILYAGMYDQIDNHRANGRQ